MSHAFEKTLLAKFGFQDPDRKNNRHELACQYLAHRQLDVIRAVAPPKNEIKIEYSDGSRIFVFNTIECKPSFEKWVFKGRDQYRQDIGRMDIFLDVKSKYLDISKDAKEAGTFDYSSVSVEVKITRVSVSDIIAQLNLYRDHFKHDKGVSEKAITWVVATEFSLNSIERESLLIANIKHIRLSHAFDEWARRAAVDDDADETEI